MAPGNPPPPMDNPKLQGFNIIQTTYKRLEGGQGIRADILVPKTAFVGKRPVVLHYHAGGLTFGDSLYMPWWPHWLSDIALRHGAVVVSPNYRLLPESTVPDAFQDIDDFWEWMHSPALTKLLQNHSTPTEIDLSRIMTYGCSAGGLLSVATAMKRPNHVRTSLAMYPWVEPTDIEPRSFFPFGIYNPESVSDDVMKAAVGAPPKTSDMSHERLNFMLASTQWYNSGAMYTHHCRDATVEQRRYYMPLEALENPEGIQLPPGGLTITAVRSDTIVPRRMVEKFAKRAHEVKGGSGVVYIERDGEHTFDTELRFDEEPWWSDALKRPLEVWLRE